MGKQKTIKDLKNFLLEIQKLSYWERFPGVSNYDLNEYIKLVDKINNYIMRDK